jgi:hypothetical protein
MPRREAALLLVVLALGITAPAADRPAPARSDPDDEFLEFLGSVDSETSGPQGIWWIDYLSKTDTAKAMKPPAGPKPPPGAKPAQPKPSAPGGTQNNG